MLTPKEEEFIAYWAANREKQKKSFRQFIQGMSRGLAIGAAILLLVISGWYQRANMEANSKLSASVLVVALVIIAIFMAWLYQSYQWEMKEQQYLELLAKKKKANKDMDNPPSLP
jgi:cobalamin synthase